MLCPKELPVMLHLISDVTAKLVVAQRNAIVTFSNATTTLVFREI